MKFTAVLLSVLALAGSALAQTQTNIEDLKDDVTAAIGYAQDCNLNAEGCVADGDFWSTVDTDAWPVLTPLAFQYRESFVGLGCVDYGISGYYNAQNLSGARFFLDGLCFYIPQQNSVVPCFNGVPDAISGGSNQEYMQLASSAGLPCAVVAKEYISANLNLCNGACADSQIINDLIYLVEYMYEKCAPLTPDIMPNATEWEAVLRLRRYNSGELVPVSNTTCDAVFGAAACPIVPINTTEYSCVTPPTTPCEVHATCEGGCTQSQGFWKNRRYNPKDNKATSKKNQKTPVSYADYCAASFRNQWTTGSTCSLKDADGLTKLECRRGFVQPASALAAQCDDPDYSIVDVFTTSPSGGQACITSVREMIAAEMNEGCTSTNACMPDEIRTTLDAMWDIVEEHCQCLGQASNPNGLNKNATNVTRAARFDLVRYTKIIESYNSGGQGPGSCEDVLGSSAAAAEPVVVDGMVAEGWFIWGIIAIVIIGLCVLGACFSFCLGWFGDSRHGYYHMSGAEMMQPEAQSAAAYYNPQPDPVQVVQQQQSSMAQRQPFQVGRSN